MTDGIDCLTKIKTSNDDVCICCEHVRDCVKEVNACSCSGARLLDAASSSIDRVGGAMMNAGYRIKRLTTDRSMTRVRTEVIEMGRKSE